MDLKENTESEGFDDESLNRQAERERRNQQEFPEEKIVEQVVAQATFETLIGASSCGKNSTVLLSVSLAFKNGFAAMPNASFKGAIIGLVKNPTVYVHEFGHTFAGLNDEYTYSDADFGVSSFQLTNCSLTPAKDYRYGNSLYGGTHYNRCSFGVRTDSYGDVISPPQFYYRPAQISVMGGSDKGKVSNRPRSFNAVSCGYIIAAIKGGDPKSYFPECAGMRGVISEKTAVSFAPFERLLSWFGGVSDISSETVTAAAGNTSGALTPNNAGDGLGYAILESFDPDTEPWGRLIKIVPDNYVAPITPITPPVGGTTSLVDLKLNNSNTPPPILAGSNATLSWTVPTTYYKCSGSWDISARKLSAPTGSVSVTPTKTTSYTLVCTNQSGQTIGQKSVTVRTFTTDRQDSTVAGEGCQSPPKIITVGGMGTPARHKIFSFMDEIAPGSKRIPLRLRSVARNTVTLREEINKLLKGGDRVLVVGHSLGSVIAYNIKDEYVGKCVEFIYIDPPYNDPVCKIPPLNLLPAFKAIRKAACDGIGSDADSINWTNGNGLLRFFTHDAFTFPSYRNNRENLGNLKGVIEDHLRGNCTGGCSSSTIGIPSPVQLKPPPQINGTLSSRPSSSSIGPGDTLTISGSGFSPVGNIVELEHSTNSDIYYEQFDLTNNQGQLSFVLPASPVTQENTTPGEYILRVSAVDSDWSNTIPITIIASLSPATTPNLTVSSLSATGSSAGAGILYAGEMSVRATIVNRGGTTATTFRNIFQYRDVTNGGAWTDWVRFEVSGLAEGARADVTHTWDGGAGKWEFRLFTDSGNAVTESNEQDNYSEIAPVSIVASEGAVAPSSPSSSGTAKLLLATPVISGRQAGLGKIYSGSMTISEKVTNIGDGAAPPFQILLLYSQNGRDWHDWVRVDSERLAPEAERNVLYTWNGGAGGWYFKAFEDVKDTCSGNAFVEVVPI